MQKLKGEIQSMISDLNKVKIELEKDQAKTIQKLEDIKLRLGEISDRLIDNYQKKASA